MAADEDPTDRLRALGRELEAAHPGLPDPDALRADARLQEGVRLLEGAPPKRLARLIANELPAVVAIAAVAAARGEEAGPRVTRAALDRVGDLSPAAGCLLLDALARSGAPFLTAATLPRLDEAWLEAPRLGALVAFLHERLDRGEVLRGEQLARVDEAFLERLEPVLPDDLRVRLHEPLAQWRAGLLDVSFFEALGRMLDVAAPVPCTPAGGRAAAIAAIGRALTATPPRSVLLVGEHGVGKATVARAALHALHDAGWRAFEATAADVNAGMTYVGQLEERVRELAQRAKGRRIAWLFPGLEAAIWAGQHQRNERGLLDALLPHVEVGDVVVVGQLEPRAYEQLVRLRPAVAGAFELVRLAPLGSADAGAVAAGWLEHAGLDAAPGVAEEAVDLAGHYLGGVAAPGGALRLLRLAAERAAAAGRVTLTGDVLLDSLSNATGLPLEVLDPRVRLDLGAVRRGFARRVLGQPEAVDCLVERMALVKAGLTDPTRPLGVLLFVGPTGTGKTELAKALAGRLFGSEDRLVRLDMSEFQTADGLDRLLADTAVEGHGTPLIASVRAHPFSVVLLDEFEKAHPSVWDLFLQVFDDGRLTDRGGRTTDFRRCVIILTANVGSALPSGPGLGFAGAGDAFHEAAVERAVARAFRPELLNRFDRVVVFRPLGRDIMRALLRSELEAVLDRRGLRAHPWAVEWDDAAVDFLLERGFSAELGARPLKRAIERHVLAPLATAIVERQFPAGDQFLFLGVRGDAIEVRFVDPDADEADGAAAAPVPALEALRERVGRLGDRKAAALAQTREPGFWERADGERAQVLSEVEQLDRLEAAFETAERLARRADGRATDLLAGRLLVLERACDGLEAGAPPEAVLRVRPSPRSGAAGEAWAAELRAMYQAWARRRGLRAAAGDDGALRIWGLGAHPVLAEEAGLHVLEQPGPGGVRRIAAQVLVDGVPARRAVTRRYRREPSPLVRDAVRGWRTGRLDRVLGGDFDLAG